MAVLGVLALPTVAGATGSGYDSTGGGAGSGGATGVEPPVTTGEPTTSGATGEATDTEGSDDHDHDSGSKGCSVGARGTAPGVLALALLGLQGLRRRRA